MPRYFPKKQTQTEHRFEIATSRNKYLLTCRESSTSILIFIGGIDTYCVEFQIFPDNPIASLSKIAYDEKCSLTGRYERGTDTHTLLSLMFSYIQDNFPYVKKLQFDDYSSRECSHRTHIDLACFSYVLYTKTWYMKHMDATDYENFVSKTQQFINSKVSTPWEMYNAVVTTRHPLPTETMQDIYTHTATWPEFFTEVKDRVGNICEYMSPWIVRFVGLDFKSSPFIMDVDKLRISYEMKSYITSGGQYTRRTSCKRKKSLTLL